jgi:hypothetical protein
MKAFILFLDGGSGKGDVESQHIRQATGRVRSRVLRAEAAVEVSANGRIQLAGPEDHRKTPAPSRTERDSAKEREQRRPVNAVRKAVAEVQSGKRNGTSTFRHSFATCWRRITMSSRCRSCWAIKTSHDDDLLHVMEAERGRPLDTLEW